MSRIVHTKQSLEQTRAREIARAIRRLLVAADPAFYQRTLDGLLGIRSGKEMTLFDFRTKIGRGRG